MSNPDQDYLPFTRGNSVDPYVNRRFGTSLQRLVNYNEQSILGGLLQHYIGEGDKQVLDLPCGYGRFLPLFHRLGYRVNCMDLSPSMTIYVQNRDDLGARDIVQEGDIRGSLPLDTSSMDAVCCIRMFQHFHHPEWRREALAELARVSKRYVIATFYDRGSVHFWSKQQLARLRGKKVRVQMISRAMFEAEAAAVGLKMVEYRPLLPRIHAQTFTVLEKV